MKSDVDNNRYRNNKIMRIYNRRCEKMKTNTYKKNLKENFVRITTNQEKAIIKYWSKNIGN